MPLDGPPGRRIDFLLLIRATAFFLVFAQHVMYSISKTLWDHVLIIGPLQLSWLFNGAGSAGVQVFFCLSGYLMGKGFERERYQPGDPLAFYWRRFFRIAPAYVCYVLVVIVVALPHLPDPGLLLITLSLLGFGNDRSIDPNMFGHIWSISTEIQFYAIAPLLAFAIAALAARFRSRGAALALVAVVVLGLLARVYEWHAVGEVWTSWPRYIYAPLRMNLDLFVAGMLLNYVREAYERPLRGSVPLFFLLLAGSSLVYSFISYPALTMLERWAQAIVAPALPTLVLICTLGLIALAESINSGQVLPSTLTRWLRPFAYLGTISYSLYLWHEFFIVQLQSLYYTPLAIVSYAVNFSIIFVATLVTAYVSYHAIERPLHYVPLPEVFRSLRLSRPA